MEIQSQGEPDSRFRAERSGGSEQAEQAHNVAAASLARLAQLEHGARKRTHAVMFPDALPPDTYGPPLLFSDAAGKPLTLDLCNGEGAETADCYCRVLGPTVSDGFERAVKRGSAWPSAARRP